MKWKRIVNVVILVVMMTVSFFLGRETVKPISSLEDYRGSVQKFQAGKATFCELKDAARFYVCPMMRRSFPFFLQDEKAGLAVLYICDTNGTQGFIEMVSTSPEARNKIINGMLEKGYRVEPHCTAPDKEIFSIKKGPWKTA